MQLYLIGLRNTEEFKPSCFSTVTVAVFSFGSSVSRVSAEDVTSFSETCSVDDIMEKILVCTDIGSLYR